MDLPSVAVGAERPYISTGHLPVHEMVWRPAPVGNFKSDTNENPVGRLRPRWPFAFRQPSENEGDT
jgi:hypothetical protein